MSFFRKLPLFLKYVYKDWKFPPADRPYGIMCFVGLPGSGKTLSLVEDLIAKKEIYPKAKIYTNFGFKNQDGEIKSWKDLINITNGADGVIFGLDEVHSMFGRNDWRDMPAGILQVFSQNRKHAKQFLCTAQSYADIVVDIRRRCQFIVECRTVLNRWVIQRAFNPQNYQDHDGERKLRKRAWRNSFIATDEIYDAYDTYAIIESLSMIPQD